MQFNRLRTSSEMGTFDVLRHEAQEVPRCDKTAATRQDKAIHIVTSARCAYARAHASSSRSTSAAIWIRMFGAPVIVKRALRGSSTSPSLHWPVMRSTGSDPKRNRAQNEDRARTLFTFSNPRLLTYHVET